jgi:hypothetical protein
LGIPDAFWPFYLKRSSVFPHIRTIRTIRHSFALNSWLFLPPFVRICEIRGKLSSSLSPRSQTAGKLRPEVTGSITCFTTGRRYPIDSNCISTTAGAPVLPPRRSWPKPNASPPSAEGLARGRPGNRTEGLYRGSPLLFMGRGLWLNKETAGRGGGTPGNLRRATSFPANTGGACWRRLPGGRTPVYH